MGRKMYKPYKVGDILESKNYGKFKIIEELGAQYTSPNRRRMMYRIKFEDTGFETIVDAPHIKMRSIKDPYAKNICGVACIGRPEIMISSNPVYNIWGHMIRRCYDKTSKGYPDYGGAGISVDSDWLCFENFYNDVQKLKGYNHFINGEDYQLDKDLLQMGIPKDKKIYSKNTCQFIPRRLNNQIRSIEHGNNAGYIGVFDTGNGTYGAKIRDTQGMCHIGYFSTKEIAAAAYNDYISVFHPELLPNNVPYMTHKEIREADLVKHELCKIVSKEPNIAAKEYLTPVQVLTPAIQHFVTKNL